MSNPVSLPPLENLFEGDQVSRGAYERLLPLEEQWELSIRVLGQMLIQAPSLAGRVYVAGRINNCATDQEVADLGESCLNEFIKYFRGASARPKRSVPMTESHPDSLVISPVTHEEVKQQALIRDNYRCMLSGIVDADSLKSVPHLLAEAEAANSAARVIRCCYIFPKHMEDAGVEDSQHPEPTNNWSFARLLGDIPEHELRGPGIHGLRNILSLELGISRSFDKFWIWLEPTGVENEYALEGMCPVFCNGLPKVITLSTSSNFPLPDPRYLALHAALGRIIKMSGATLFIIRTLDEAEQTKTLAEDGSSSKLLKRIFPAESVDVC